MKNKNWKRKALANAVAGAFVCGLSVMSSHAAAEGSVYGEIGGLKLVSENGAPFVLSGTDAPPASWSFATSSMLGFKYEDGQPLGRPLPMELSAIKPVSSKRYTWSSLSGDGTTQKFVHDVNETVTFADNPNETCSLFNYLASGENSNARIENVGGGTVNFRNQRMSNVIGYMTDAKALGRNDKPVSKAMLLNGAGGTMNFSGKRSYAVSWFSGGVLENHGTVNVNGYGINYLGESGKNCLTLIDNGADGILNIVGSDSRSAINSGVSVAVWARDPGTTLTFNNSGSALISGGGRTNEYGLRTVMVRDDDADAGASVLFNNQRGGTFVIKSGTGAAAVYSVLDFRSVNLGEGIEGEGLVTFENEGTFTISSDNSNHAINTLVYGPNTFGMNSTGENVMSTARFNNAGVMNWLGNAKGNAINKLTDGSGSTSTVLVTNNGVWNLNRYAIGSFGPGAVRFTNTSSGTINAEAAVMFDGSYSAPVLSGSQKKDISLIDTNGSAFVVSTDKFSVGSLTQTGSLSLKQDWVDRLVLESGSSIAFTDVGAGTALADSIKSQVEASFGAGANISFTGTGSGSAGGSGLFDMNVVNALIAEGKLASGSVVTSEALVHDGKTFTLGNAGDMTQDAGFMGIHGSTGIAVKDGKTLTLMGSQASMAMAVGADVRDGSYVITDAPMTLENGTLNLGHKNLSATEGRLAAVMFDRGSSVNVEKGIYAMDSIKGEGSLILSTDARTTVSGDLSATQIANSGTLTVGGVTVLGASQETASLASAYAAPKAQSFANEKGATADLSGGLVVNDFATVRNMDGATLHAGHVKLDTFGRILNYAGATMTYDSIEADGIVNNLGNLIVKGAYVIGDEGETTFSGETQVRTLTVGRSANRPTSFFRMARTGNGAVLRNTGKTYADELDLVSGSITVENNAILAGKTLKNGAVGSTIKVDIGGTFAFSHDKQSLNKALEGYSGTKNGKAVLALNTDLHFGSGGSLTVGTVAEEKGAVNLGSNALLLLGTTELHGEALLNGESTQHLHVEDGAVIALTDDLVWGNHYLLKGFDEASVTEVLKVGVVTKDGQALASAQNDRGVFVTVGSTNILDKDKAYRLTNQMNRLLDGHQNLNAKEGDVAFLTNALVNQNGASATNRMEALAFDAGILAETYRVSSLIHTTMLDHASEGRRGAGAFWASGLYAKTKSGDFRRSSGVSAYEADTTGFAFGADVPLVRDSWRMGAAFTAQRGELDGNDGLSSDIEGYGLSLYGGKTFASGMSLTGTLTYMTSTHDMKMFNMGNVQAKADADAWVLGARLSMPFAWKRVWMTPYLGVDALKVKQDAFGASWNDMDAFEYAEAESTTVRVPVGVKVGTYMPMTLLRKSGTLNLDADFSYVPAFGEKEAESRITGVTIGESDAVKGAFVNDWMTKASVGLSWQAANGAVGLHYSAEKGDVRKISSGVKASMSLYF